VKNRASLLKTLTRLDRCSKMCLARIETIPCGRSIPATLVNWRKRRGKCPGPSKHHEIVAGAGIGIPPDFAD